jgi:hypothetical protein
MGESNKARLARAEAELDKVGLTADQAVQAVELAAEASRQARLWSRRGRHRRERGGSCCKATAKGSLPLDPERARIELTEEERARRSSRPKSRRWRGLAKLDDKIDELTRRLENARQERQRAEERVQGAPEADARSLAAWIAGGERGKRPEATVYERQRELDAAQLTLEALQRTLDEALEERVQYVERHRETMLADAQKDVMSPARVSSPMSTSCRRCAKSSSTPATS